MKNFLKSNHIHRLFFLALLFCLALGQLQRIVLPSGGAFYAHDLVVTAWLIFFVGGWLQARHPLADVARYFGRFFTRTLRNSPSFWLLAWLAVATGVSVAAGMGIGTSTEIILSDSSLLPLLYLGRLLAYCSLLIIISRTRVLPVTWLVSGTIWLGCVWFLFGVLQLVFMPDLRSLRWLGFDDHYYRLAGTFFDPNFVGLALTLTLIWLHTLASKNVPNWKINLLSLVLIAGVAATYSRASYLSLALALPVLLVFRRSKKISLPVVLLGCLVVGITTWLLLPKPGGEGVNLLRSASIQARITAATLDLQSVSGAEWVLGNGLYTTKPLFLAMNIRELPNHARVPDNFFVMLLIAGGLPALLLGFAAIMEWGKRLWTWKAPAVAALVAVLVHAQFTNSLLEPFLFLYVGLGVVSLYLMQLRSKANAQT